MYPLTPEGVERKQNQLFELSQDELRKVAIEIANDLRNWVYNNFELTVDQKAYYEKIPSDYNLIMGWQSASSILNKELVVFGEVPANFTADQKKKRTTKTEASATVSYSEANGWSGSVGVKIFF